MSLLEEFLTAQHALGRKHSDFLESLAPERTVTLLSLLEDESAAQKLGIAHWLEPARFRSRFAAMARFFAGLPRQDLLKPYGSFVFFQSTDESEDAEQQRRLSGYFQDYAETDGEAPWLTRYLHTETNFSEMTWGSWESRDRVIVPGMMFSNREWESLYATDPGVEVPAATALGYRIPDYAALLGVSNAIATDYFARFVIHDIGHGRLPGVHPHSEPLHDAVMVGAMGARRYDTYRTVWEKLVHRECVDPFFFLEALSLTQRVLARGNKLSAVQASYAQGVAKWHRERQTGSASHSRMWGFRPGMQKTGKRCQVQRSFKELRETGFERFDGTPAKI